MKEPAHPADTVELRDPHGSLGGDSIENDHSSASRGLDGSDVPLQHAVLPAWNQNRANSFKTLSTFVAFIIMGANDAAYGVSKLGPGEED
jgi:hypothetical protein